MNTPLTSADLAHLEAALPADITTSMLDGYLAASASGPNFVMPDRVLFWVSETAAVDALPGTEIAKLDQTVNDLIIRQYQAVNDALNDQTYAPHLADPQAWCRGYMSGVGADHAAWEPFIVEQGGLMMQVWIYSIHVNNHEIDTATTFLTDVTRQIHAYWLARRRQGKDVDGLIGPRWPLQIPPPVATPNSTRQDAWIMTTQG